MPPADGAEYGISRRGRVRVANPEQPAVVGHHEIRVVVVAQERRDRGHAIRDVAVIQHAAVGGDVVAEQNLQRLEADAEEQPPGEAADAHAVGAAVDRLDVLFPFGLRVVKLLCVRVHEHVVVRQLAEVDARLLDVDVAGTDDCGGMSFTNRIGSPSCVTSFTGPSVRP